MWNPPRDPLVHVLLNSTGNFSIEDICLLFSRTTVLPPKNFVFYTWLDPLKARELTVSCRSDTKTLSLTVSRKKKFWSNTIESCSSWVRIRDRSLILKIVRATSVRMLTLSSAEPIERSSIFSHAKAKFNRKMIFTEIRIENRLENFIVRNRKKRRKFFLNFFVCFSPNVISSTGKAKTELFIRFSSMVYKRFFFFPTTKIWLKRRQA